MLREHQEVNFQGGKIQMRVKQIRVLLLAFACCSLLAVAQDSSLTNVTGGGSTNKIPRFTGAHSIGNSIMKQSSGNINVAGGVAATLGGSANVNSVSGSNTSGPGTAQGAGTYGQMSTTGQSSTGLAWGNGGGGAWGDGGTDSNYAVIGTTDDKAAGIFQNNGSGFYTNFAFNFATGGTGYPWAVFNGDGAGCSIDPTGTFSCTGTKNAVVPVDGGKHQVAMSAIESPRVWFEDFGSAQLRGGVAVVRIDPKFIQTVNTSKEYHVFLTPNGDCKGLYVNQKSQGSFEVRELGGGNANIKFDYRITALRKGYENVRFKDHSREFPMNKDGRIRPATK
jgi:hypothetical protein